MRHFSCDLCGKDLVPGSDARYLISMAARPIVDGPDRVPGDAAPDVEDPVAAMDELLAEMDCEETPPENTIPTLVAPLTREFDLCPSCFSRFAADPLGRQRARKMHFSAN